MFKKSDIANYTELLFSKQSWVQIIVGGECYGYLK